VTVIWGAARLATDAGPVRYRAITNRLARSSVSSSSWPSRSAGDSVAERAAQPLQDRSLEQERTDSIGLLPEYLLAEVVQDVAMAARKRFDERVGIGASAQRQRLGCNRMRSSFFS
jgi:hypothetical protein